jgi:hypothetical protein
LATSGLIRDPPAVYLDQIALYREKVADLDKKLRVADNFSASTNGKVPALLTLASRNLTHCRRILAGQPRAFFEYIVVESKMGADTDGPVP